LLLFKRLTRWCFLKQVAVPYLQEGNISPSACAHFEGGLRRATFDSSNRVWPRRPNFRKLAILRFVAWRSRRLPAEQQALIF